MVVSIKILKAFCRHESFQEDGGQNQTLENWECTLHGDYVSVRLESLCFLYGGLVYGYHFKKNSEFTGHSTLL